MNFLTKKKKVFLSQQCCGFCRPIRAIWGTERHCNLMGKTTNTCIYVLLYASCWFKLSPKVKWIFCCCFASPATVTMMCEVINSEYRTGSEVDSLWVQASVADGSALPWKIGHLGASWRTSLPCCGSTTQVPTGLLPP